MSSIRCVDVAAPFRQSRWDSLYCTCDSFMIDRHSSNSSVRCFSLERVRCAQKKKRRKKKKESPDPDSNRGPSDLRGWQPSSEEDLNLVSHSVTAARRNMRGGNPTASSCSDALTNYPTRAVVYRNSYPRFYCTVTAEIMVHRY